MERLERGLRRMADVVGRSTSPRPETLRSDGSTRVRSSSNTRKTTHGWNYKPLSSEFHEIRILTLVEGKSASNATMKCSMEHVSLVDPGDYTALSYCWGDTRDAESVLINGFKIQVTANLSGALQELFAHGHRRVWVDALCINQDDREERSLQVRNMRLVYSKAKIVVSWVGHAAEKDALIIKVLLEDNYLMAKQYNLWLGDDERAPRLRYFFEKPYWKRVWIIQEVAIATDVTILYGKVEISWDALARKLDMWRADPNLAPISLDNYSYALRLWEFRYKLSVANIPITLIEAMHWSHKSFATDPRDRIFALLGISVDGPALVPLPNYKQSLHEVITDLTFALMAADRSLDLICVKESRARATRSTQPSWMLDLFEVWAQPTPLISYTLLHMRRNYSHKPLMERIENGGLRVSAKMLDSIHTLSSIATSPSNPQVTRHAFAAPRHELYGNTNGINDAIWKSLTMGACTNASEPGATEVLKGFRSCFMSLWTPEGRELFKNAPLVLEWLEQNASLRIGTATLEERSLYKEDQPSKLTTFFERMLGTSTDKLAPQISSYFVTSVRDVLEGSMRLMMTSKGFIGLAHPAAAIGDEIGLIAGCSVPVVLRSDLGPMPTYRVIGGSYIHGISDARETVADISLLGNQLRGMNESSMMFSATKEIVLF